MPVLLDAKLFHLINRICPNPALDLIMRAVTFLGSGEFVLALSILLIVVPRKKQKICGIALLSGMVVTRELVHYLKNVFVRVRPFAAITDARLLITELDRTHSFPSGHATAAFMAAVVLSRYFKRGYIFYILAALVAFSRVYVGAHYVSDVVAGALLGGATGCAIVFLADRLTRKIKNFSD